MGAFFQPSFLLQLAEIIIDPNNNVPDHVGWLDPDGRNFTVASAYKVVTGGSETDGWASWMKI